MSSIEGSLRVQCNKITWSEEKLVNIPPANKDKNKIKGETKIACWSGISPGLKQTNLKTSHKITLDQAPKFASIHTPPSLR